MSPRQPVYVECLIRCDLETLWTATQDPDQHTRWDVRFARISYQPRQPGSAQRFTYSTRVAPGLKIEGTGQTLGDRDRPDGSRWSGLRFWTSDPRSIIERGGGHWRYIPTADGVRFLTRYDYLPRWGRLGASIDRWVFRPGFGWATAWSFDRLRLWLENGIPPERSRNRWIAHAVAVSTAMGAALLSVGTVLERTSRSSTAALLAVTITAVAVAALSAGRRPSGRRPTRTGPARRTVVRSGQ